MLLSYTNKTNLDFSVLVIASPSTYPPLLNCTSQTYLIPEIEVVLYVGVNPVGFFYTEKKKPKKP